MNIPKYYIKFFHSFGLAYWYDQYLYPYNEIADGCHNIIFFFIRVQIRVWKRVEISEGGKMKEFKY
jgi:hypothetical protein